MSKCASKANYAAEEAEVYRRRDSDDSDLMISEEDSDSSPSLGPEVEEQPGAVLEKTSVEDSDDLYESLEDDPHPAPLPVGGPNKRTSAAHGLSRRRGRGRFRISHHQARSSGGTGESWKDTRVLDITPPPLIFTPRRPPGPQLSSSASYTPLQLFKLFFTDAVLTTIIRNTNEYAALTSTPADHWADVSLTDFHCFLGLLTYTGVVQLGSFTDYWRKARLYGLTFPETVMSCERFLQICRFLHLSSRADDVANDEKRGTPGYDRLVRIKPLYNELREACKRNYHPTQNIFIDEHTVASNTCDEVKQSDPARRGCKLFALADSSNGYTWDFFVSDGRSRELTGNGQSYDSVMQLVDTDTLGTGYKLFLDSFCSSPMLFRDLLQKQIRACGTIEANRVGYPESRINTLNSKSPEGSIRWMRKDELLFVQWKGPELLSFCSTLHTAHGEDTVRRRVKGADGRRTVADVPVPPAAKEYTQYFGQDDESDVVIGHYKVQHKTLKWYKAFFHHFMDIVIVNAFVLHQEHARSSGETPMGHAEFRETLALELADAACATAAGPAPRKPAHHRPMYIAGGRLLPCGHCGAKTPLKCSTCDVPLCLNRGRDCYNAFHDANDL